MTTNTNFKNYRAKVEDYIVDCLESFVMDPPDSDYQEGYLAGFLEFAEYLGIDVPNTD